MRTKLLRGCVTVVLLVLFLPRETARAQEPKPERGRIEIGVRQLYGDRNSAKFNEYRDIPQGFFIQYGEVNFNDLLNNSFFFNFQTRHTRQKDQTYLASLGVHRKYRLELQYDQTPHVFTTTAKTFFSESTPGVFHAPDPLRNLLQSQPGNLQALLDDARHIDIALRRDKGSGTFTYTPTPDWAWQLQYSREKQTGHRPFGTTHYFTYTLEFPEPIDYRTDQIKAGTEFANKRGGFQASYSGSFLTNKVGTLLWDNPFRVTDIVDGPTQGRLDLYPDNSAHNVSLAGAVNIPHSTRFMASVVPGWMRQNDSFLPYTVNPAISVCPANFAFPPLPRPAATLCVPNSLPAASLDGRKQTLAMNYTLTSRAIPEVPLTLRYRQYDYNNNSRSLIFDDYVATDMHVSGNARRNLPYAYNRKTLGLDASWEFVKNSSAKFLYEWERFGREFREVEQSNEHTFGAAFDLNPRDWLLLKASYRHSERDPEHYDAEAHEESFPLGEGPFGLGPIEELRKFDEAARSRHRAEALIQITPVDQFSFSAAYGTTQDDYDKSVFGLQKDINFNYSFEVTYTPRSAVSFFAEYTRERYKYRQRSRQRTPPSATAPANDSPNNDWESNLRDVVDTWAAGLDASVPNKVIFNAFYSLSTAKNRILTSALGNPRLAGFLVTTAQDYPDTSNRWHQLVASVRFPLKAGLTPKLEYRYEKYDRVDFQLVNVGQYITLDPSTATSIFLGVGADVPGYNAHIVSASLEYRF